MLKIYLNDREVDENFKSLSLPDLLIKIKDDLKDQILKQIFVNEVEVNEKYLKESLLDKDDIDELRFITQKTEDVIEETLKEADEYLPRLKNGVLTTAKKFRDDENEAANKKYQNILEGIEWYVDVLNKIISILDDEELYNKHQKLVKKMNEQLSQLMVAYNKDDMVLVADILEYEIEEYIDKFIELNQKVNLKYNEVY